MERRGRVEQKDGGFVLFVFCFFSAVRLGWVLAYGHGKGQADGGSSNGAEGKEGRAVLPI